MRLTARWPEPRLRDLALRLTFGVAALAVVSGFVADGWQWALLGCVIGVPGALLPYLSRRLDWRPAVTWVLLVTLVLAGLGVINAVAT